MGDDYFLCPNCNKKKIDLIVYESNGAFKRIYHSWNRGWHKKSWHFGYYGDRDKIINDPLGLPMIVGKEMEYDIFESYYGYQYQCEKCGFTTNDFRYFTK